MNEEDHKDEISARCQEREKLYSKTRGMGSLREGRKSYGKMREVFATMEAEAIWKEKEVQGARRGGICGGKLRTERCDKGRAYAGTLGILWKRRRLWQSHERINSRCSYSTY